MIPLLKFPFFGLCLAVLTLLSPLAGSAMSVIPPTFGELVARAETVARVEVTGQSTRWDTSASGKKVIHTYVECKVIKQLKGTPQTTLSLRLLGGQVGNEVMEISDMPTFVTGQHYIVFVAANGKAFCPLVGVMHGKYSLSADAAGTDHVRRNNGAPLRSAAEVSTSDESESFAPGELGMTRDDFEAAISAEVQHASGK